MIRPDNYILKLKAVKQNLQIQVMHCKRSLVCLEAIKKDPNYDDIATTLEKSNIDEVTQLISGGLQVLQRIFWEEPT